MLNNLTISKCRDAMYCVSTKSRRDDTLLTVGFNLRNVETDNYPSLPRPAWDNTLLTVGFNLRNVETQCRNVETQCIASLPSPAGTIPY